MTVLSHIIAGSAAGAAATITVHPLDIVQARIQHGQGRLANVVTGTGAAPSSSSSSSSSSSGINNNNKKKNIVNRGPARTPVFRFLADVVRHEGPLGLTKGLAPPLSIQVVRFSAVFGAAEAARDMLGNPKYKFAIGRSHSNNNADISSSSSSYGLGKWVSSVIASGAVAGVCTSPLMASADNIKLTMQVHEGRRKMTIGESVKVCTSGEAGIFGLVRGAGLTVLRDSPGFMIYFGLSEVFIHHTMEWLSKKEERKQQHQQQQQQSLMDLTEGHQQDQHGQHRINRNGSDDGSSGISQSDVQVKTPPVLAALCGGTAGLISWMAMYPMDVLKTNFQLRRHHSKVFPVIREMIAENGIRRFYRGFKLVVMRGFPANAVNFVVYKMVSEWLEKKD